MCGDWRKGRSSTGKAKFEFVESISSYDNFSTVFRCHLVTNLQRVCPKDTCAVNFICLRLQNTPTGCFTSSG